MVVPSALVVVVIGPAIIVAGMWLATVSPVSVPCASASTVGSVVVVAALVVGSGALPLIVGVIGPLGGVVVVLMVVLWLIVGHGIFLKIL